ncbi:MAG: hypothetical protein ACPG1C_08605 [Alphaproteobacteria bacterium]
MEAAIILAFIGTVLVIIALGVLVRNHAAEKYTLKFLGSGSFVSIVVGAFLVTLAILLGMNTDVGQDNILVLQWGGVAVLAALAVNMVRTSVIFGLVLTLFQILAAVCVIPILLAPLAALARHSSD